MEEDFFKRDSFVFYRSFFECIEEAEPESQTRLYRAIADYALNHTEPKNLKGLEKGMWIVIKPQLDANLKKYVNGCKGGAPIGNINAKKKGKKQPKNNQKQPNENENENENKNDNDNELDSKTGFTPSLNEIMDFFLSKSNNDQHKTELLARSFFYTFDSVGWIDKDGEPINNWKGMAMSWIYKINECTWL